MTSNKTFDEIQRMTDTEIVQQIIENIIVHCHTRTKKGFEEYVIKFLKDNHISCEVYATYLTDIITKKWAAVHGW
jgi:hypothetical protein